MKLRSSLGFLLLLIATSLIAQTFRGTILGTVTDPQGAVIPGAKVTVHNINTGLERTTQTSAVAWPVLTSRPNSDSSNCRPNPALWRSGAT